MAMQKEKVFSVIMCSLLFFFLAGFLMDFNGTQRAVFYARGENYMADYHNVAKFSAERNPYGYGLENNESDAIEREYPPLAYVLGYVWSRGSDYANLPGMEAGNTDIGIAVASIFMFSVGSLFLLLLYDAVKKEKIYKVLITVCMMFSGIFLFAFERGNNIFVAALCSAFFILNYQNKNKFVVECAYIALAVAAGLKVYPALLGILLLFDKNYKGAFRLICYGIALGFLPFLFFEGGFRNLSILLRNSRMSVDGYALGVFARFNFRFWVSQIGNPELQRNIYTIVGVINKLLCGAAVVASFFQTKQWKRVMLLLLVIVIFPVNSGQYTGLYLFIGMVLFLNEEEHSILDAAYLLMIVLMLNPFQVVVNECNYTTWAMNLSASIMLIVLTTETLWIVIKTKYGHVMGTLSLNSQRKGVE